MRVLGPVLLVAAIVGIVVAGNFRSGQTSAQDTSDERILNLETLVNELAAQVADLTARVEALEGTSGGAATPPCAARPSTTARPSCTGRDGPESMSWENRSQEPAHVLVVVARVAS